MTPSKMSSESETMNHDEDYADHHDEMPNVIKNASPHGEETRSVRYVYLVRRYIQTAIIWTVYAFQLIMAGVVLYRAIAGESTNVIEYWTIIVGLLVSLFAISWVEQNIIFKDDLDG